MTLRISKNSDEFVLFSYPARFVRTPATRKEASAGL
jgi:hypothetical protein